MGLFVSPNKLKQSNKNFQQKHQAQDGKIFWDTGKICPLREF